MAQLKVKLAKMRVKRLRIAFTTEAAFLAEYTNNIANGGIFLATNKPFEMRDPVQVELHLDYRDDVVTVDGEVVHSVPVEMTSTGALPGVAVQFYLEGSELHDKFRGIVSNVHAGSDASEETGRRRASRIPARVSAAVSSEDGNDFAARTRDISRTGALISTGGKEMSLGQNLSLDLAHPISGDKMSVGGKVVRHVLGSDGAVSAVGVEFNVADERAPELGRFVDRVKASEHSRRLGIINGTIEGYGCEKLLRMFASTAPLGTFSVYRGGDEGAVVFNETGFVSAYCGRRTDREALAEIMTWEDGDFEFEIAIEPIFRSCEGMSFDDVIDEIRGSSAHDMGTRPVAKPPQLRSLIDARIRVDFEALDSQMSGLSKSEEAVIDLAIVGMPVRKVVQIIPEPEAQVVRAIESLVEQGLVVVDA